MRWSRRWGRLVGLVLVVAAGWFLFRTVDRNWRELQSFDWQADPVLLLSSVAAHVLVLALGVLVWSRVLRHFPAPPVPFPALLRVWALSNAARYIPGSVWQFFAAAQLSREIGLSGALALTSMLVHVALSLLSAVVIGATVFPLQQLGIAAAATPWVRGAVVLAAVIVVHPAVINTVLRAVPRALHREVLAWSGSWPDGVFLLVLAHLSWLAYGVAYSLFVAALAPVPVGAYPVLTAVNAVSFVAGYLAVLVPGGIGVRESVMTLLLSPLLPAGVAAVLAIGARLWSVLAEVLLAATGQLLVVGRRAAKSP